MTSEEILSIPPCSYSESEVAGKKSYACGVAENANSDTEISEDTDADETVDSCGVCEDEDGLSLGSDFSVSGSVLNGEKSDACDVVENPNFDTDLHEDMGADKTVYPCDVSKDGPTLNSDSSTANESVLNGEKSDACDGTANEFSSTITLDHVLQYIPATDESVGDVSKEGSVLNPLSSHSKQKPAKNKLFPCHICNKVFSVMGVLKSHIIRHTGERPFVCEICKKSFIRKCDVKRHQLIHTNDRPYVCDICGFRFTELSKLKSHVFTHGNVKQYTCDICNKGFNSKGHMDRHLRSHTGERPYSCEVCERKFFASADLRQHRFIHLAEKPFICDFCNKGFSRKPDFVHHRRIHTGERPFTCDTCGSGFTNKSNLTRHIQIHTGDQPYACDVCGRRFPSITDLTKHNYDHTGERPFVCDTCQKGFKSRIHLVRHLKTHGITATS